jgi:hypothetical protein
VPNPHRKKKAAPASSSSSSSAPKPSPAANPLAEFKNGVFSKDALREHFGKELVLPMPPSLTDLYGNTWEVTAASTEYQLVLNKTKTAGT